MQEFLSKDNEPVNPERWQWITVLKDGSELLQFDYKEVQYHYFGEIEQDKVSKLGLVHPQTGRKTLIDVPEGAKLIHFYDNIIQTPLGGTAIHHRLYSFGYELGKEKKLYTVLPNDFIIEGDSSKIGVL